MESREPRANIGYICDDCIPERFPRAGLFPPSEVKESTHVKANFGGEHMWIEIDKVSSLGHGSGVRGTVANDPERPGSPPHGTEVFIPFDKIEDLGKF